jgi:hypothetical protein
MELLNAIAVGFRQSGQKHTLTKTVGEDLKAIKKG